MALSFRAFARRVKRRLLRVDQQLKHDYLSKNPVRKLHIGCGDNTIAGWLNSDYYPQFPSVFALDATKPLPFEDDTFDYVFSEHMIEHITFQEGLNLLTECHRVLKSKGTMRISTPDLEFLLWLHKKDTSDLQHSYIKWATDTLIPGIPFYDAVFVINNFVRAWGHQFIYDKRMLRFSLEKAGFTKLRECNVNQSDDYQLRNLENDKRMPAGFLQLESMTFEGTKE
jgi:predicted SAM-dependent methyltransferase